MSITADRAVSLRYTLSIGGSVVESGEISYLHGYSNIVPGLEAGLEGAEAGQELGIDVPPELGYGEKMELDPQRVPRTAFPPDMPIEVGMMFHARSPEGEQLPVWVVGLEPGVVLIEPNHPLAGKTLHFDVTVLEVRDATAEELEHRHVHGPDAHSHDHGHGH